MSAHTPGPWTAECNQHADTVYAGNMRICDVRGWGYLTGVGGLNLGPEQAVAIQEDNARLIAAAPDLLAALKRLANEAHGFVGCSGRETHGNTNIAVIKDRIAEARDIIAKAEGRV